MIRELFLTAVLALSGSLQLCAEEKPQPTQREQVIAQLTSGPVSKKNEKLVRKLFEKYGIDTSDPEIIIAQPSPLAIELNPVIELTTVIPSYKLYLVNERWFNKLTKPEKEVMIASNAMAVQKIIGWPIPGTNLALPKEIGGIPLVEFIIFFIIEILLAVAFYKYLGKKTKLSKTKRVIITFITLLTVGEIEDRITGRFSPLNQKLKNDKKLAAKIGSPDGFIALLKRMQKDMPQFKKSANAQFWATYEETLEPRIKHLESLKK